MFKEIVISQDRQIVEREGDAKHYLLSILPDKSDFPYTTFLWPVADWQIHSDRLGVDLKAKFEGIELEAELEAGRITAVNMKHSVLILWEPFEIATAEPVKISIKLCASAPRHEPTHKTTRWLQERQLAFPIPPGFEEIVFGLEESHDLLEGLSSNFWIINGKIVNTYFF